MSSTTLTEMMFAFEATPTVLPAALPAQCVPGREVSVVAPGRVRNTVLLTVAEDITWLIRKVIEALNGTPTKLIMLNINSRIHDIDVNARPERSIIIPGIRITTLPVSTPVLVPTTTQPYSLPRRNTPPYPNRPLLRHPLQAPRRVPPRRTRNDRRHRLDLQDPRRCPQRRDLVVRDGAREAAEARVVVARKHARVRLSQAQLVQQRGHVRVRGGDDVVVARVLAAAQVRARRRWRGERDGQHGAEGEEGGEPHGGWDCGRGAAGWRSCRSGIAGGFMVRGVG